MSSVRLITPCTMVDKVIIGDQNCAKSTYLNTQNLSPSVIMIPRNLDGERPYIHYSATQIYKPLIQNF